MQKIRSQEQIQEENRRKAFTEAMDLLSEHFKEGIFLFAANDGLSQSEIKQVNLLMSAMVGQDGTAVANYNTNGKKLYYNLKAITNMMEINRMEWINKRTEPEIAIAYNNYKATKAKNHYTYIEFKAKLKMWGATMVDYFE